MHHPVCKKLRVRCDKVENLREAAKIATEEEELSDDSDDDEAWADSEDQEQEVQEQDCRETVYCC